MNAGAYPLSRGKGEGGAGVGAYLDGVRAIYR